MRQLLLQQQQLPQQQKKRPRPLAAAKGQRVRDLSLGDMVDENPWTAVEAGQVLQRMRRFAVQDRHDRIKRQQHASPPDVSCQINEDYVSKVDAVQNNVFDLAQDIVVDLGGEIQRLTQQHNQTVEDMKRQHRELVRQHNETLAYFRHRLDRFEIILNASRVS